MTGRSGAADDVPTRPRSKTSGELGFTWPPQRMVRWFDPAQLFRTAVRVIISEVFGAYADKRELQAAIDAPEVCTELATEPDLWLDYIADLGDGFNSTYSIAYLLSRPMLDVPAGTDDTGAPIAAVTLPRGRMLVMGGDEVYPTASRDAYRDRLVGPYTAAFPFIRPAVGPRPLVFAIPGNHDWYDGLTSFLRQFTQQRSFGAWRTMQARSYFAVQLPHRWWMFGTDIQLQTDIDKPQLDYFTNIARSMIQPGDQVILCPANPFWVEGAGGKGDAYHNLAFFERTVIQKYGATLAVTLTGDLHHYAHYRSDTGADRTSHKITAGGGGAYLFPTHRLPRKITLDRADPVDRSATDRYELGATFPSPTESKRIVWGCLKLPLVNWQFGLCIGALYLFYAWVVQSASKMLNGFGTTSLMERVDPTPLGDLGVILSAWWRSIAHSPFAVVMTLAIVVGLTFFPQEEQPGLGETIRCRVAGFVHGLCHLALNLALLCLFAWLNLHVLAMKEDQFCQIVLFCVEMLLIGGTLGSAVMACYLIAANLLLGIHTNEVFSAQSIADYKNFLRLHIDAAGTLRIYPIGVRRVCRHWDFAGAGQPEDAIFNPRSPITVRPIDAPIVIPKPSKPGHRPNDQRR